jgi:hypothetical protein
VDDPRITVAGDGIHVAGNPRTELLEAAEAALRWLDLFDQHAPSDMIFGGEAEVRGLLRDAIRRARVEAEDRTWADAADPDEAQALDEERARLGRVPTERERAASGRRGRSTRTFGSTGGQSVRGSTGSRPLFVREHNDPAPLQVAPLLRRISP